MALEHPTTHPLEIAAAWIIIGAIVAWYFGRARTTQNMTGPGSVFTISIGFKIFTCLVFLGIPAILIFALAEATHPTMAFVMTLGISLFCLTGIAGIFTTKIEITEAGFRSQCLGWKAEYRFEEFRGITFFRFGFTLERKDGRLNVGIPVFFSKSADLYDYIRRMIKNRQ